MRAKARARWEFHPSLAADGWVRSMRLAPNSLYSRTPRAKSSKSLLYQGRGIKKTLVTTCRAPERKTCSSTLRDEKEGDRTQRRREDEQEDVLREEEGSERVCPVWSCQLGDDELIDGGRRARLQGEERTTSTPMYTQSARRSEGEDVRVASQQTAASLHPRGTRSYAPRGSG